VTDTDATDFIICPMLLMHSAEKIIHAFLRYRNFSGGLFSCRTLYTQHRLFRISYVHRNTILDKISDHFYSAPALLAMQSAV